MKTAAGGRTDLRVTEVCRQRHMPVGIDIFLRVSTYPRIKETFEFRELSGAG